MATIYSKLHEDHARTELVALMNTLLTDLVTNNIDSRFSYVYNTHDVADLDIIAVSVDFEGDQELSNNDEAGNNSYLYHGMTFSIRVHIDYAGDGEIEDRKKLTEILFSIENKLREQTALNPDADGRRYDITKTGEKSNAENYPDSGTIGGHIAVLIAVGVDHSE